MSQNVVFRRVGGRVIPIRVGPSDKTKERAKGAGTAATGVAVGAAAGAVSAHLDREAAGAENVSRGVRSAWRAGIKDKAIPQKTVTRTFKVAARSRMEAKRFSIASKRVQKGGAAAGAALIGAGVHRSLKDSKLNEGEKAAVASGAGIGAHFAIRSAYTHGMQPKGFNTTTQSKHARKVLDSLKHAAKRVAARGFKL